MIMFALLILERHDLKWDPPPMVDVLDNLTPEAVLPAIDANLGSYCLHFGRLPGAEAHDDPDLRWFVGGAPDEAFNGVIHAQLEPEQVSDAIERMLDEFRRRGVPARWQIGPTTSPSTLRSALLAHGFTHDEDEPGMALDLRAMNDNVLVPPDLTIETVDDDAGLRQWIEVWGCGAPASVRVCWWNVYSFLGLSEDEPWRYYLARWNGEPVAVIKLYYDAGVVCVHHVVTIPAMRRRGIATAIVVHALREARNRGYRVAILTSSPDGFNAYQRIGFRTYCTVSRYRWRPTPMPAEGTLS
jgi:GNAT superfamily N-acetyltransferase